MPLPDDFNEWEHLQHQIMTLHNRAVFKWFKNQPNDDISTPKASLKHACLIKDNDTVSITQFRLWLFEITAGHAASLQPEIYGIPVEEFQRDCKFKPQVKLVFKKDFDPEEDREEYSPCTSEITFRLMNETSETITRANVETLAKAIKRDFATPRFVWGKGWYKCTYVDNDNGYNLRLLVKSKDEGKKVIRQVIGIRGHAFNDDYLQYIDNDRSYPINPGTHRVYGRTLKKPRRRPRVDVKFSYAQLLIHGRQTAVNLVAMGNRLRSLVEQV